MGTTNSKLLPLQCMLKNFSLRSRKEYGCTLSKRRLCTYCEIEWPSLGSEVAITSSLDLCYCKSTLGPHWTQATMISSFILINVCHLFKTHPLGLRAVIDNPLPWFLKMFITSLLLHVLSCLEIKDLFFSSPFL